MSLILYDTGEVLDDEVLELDYLFANGVVANVDVLGLLVVGGIGGPLESTRIHSFRLK